VRKTVKDKILQKLKESGSRFISGEGLSSMLNVSRTAVWKCIKELRKQGYVIEASPKKGYRLVSSPDIISPWEIKHNLATGIIGRKIIYLEEVDSTNNYAKTIAAEGCEEGTVVLAESQTCGRGRLGRSWSSAPKTGIYMSVVLRPAIAPEDVQVMTIAASVAVVSAIKKVTGIDAGIKWPNDIILGAKKVCGILTEMNSEMERVNFLVLGIGMNVNQEADDFTGELRETATSLKAFALEEGLHIKSFCRSELIRELLLELEGLYDMVVRGSTKEIIDEWKKHSVTLGKQVKVKGRNFEYRGIAVDITGDGRLSVKCDDGIIREVLSGEVSVRGILGYV